MVMGFLGVPALADESSLSGGDLPSVVFSTTVHAFLCRSTRATWKTYKTITWWDGGAVGQLALAPHSSKALGSTGDFL